MGRFSQFNDGLDWAKRKQERKERTAFAFALKAVSFCCLDQICAWSPRANSLLSTGMGECGRVGVKQLRTVKSGKQRCSKRYWQSLLLACSIAFIQIAIFAVIGL